MYSLSQLWWTVNYAFVLISISSDVNVFHDTAMHFARSSWRHVWLRAICCILCIFCSVNIAVRQWRCFHNHQIQNQQQLNHHKSLLCNLSVTLEQLFRSEWPSFSSQKSKRSTKFSEHPETIKTLAYRPYWAWELQSQVIDIWTIFKYKYIIMWLWF